MRSSDTFLASFLAITAICAIDASGQQVTIGTPFRTLNSSFFEKNGVSWSGNYKGINFNYGGGALAVPQFGGYDPAAALTTGFAITGPNGRFNLALSFGQGAKESNVTQTPSVTIMNGQTGYISDTSQTPFVVSVIPVVGAFPISPQQLADASGFQPQAADPRIQALLRAKADTDALQAGDGQAIQPAQPRALVPAQALLNPPGPGAAPAPKNQAAPQPAPKGVPPAPAPEAVSDPVGLQLGAAQESSAGRAAPSVAEARRLHEIEQGNQNDEMAAVMEHARSLEDDGKPGVAKIYYQRVARQATGDLKEQALQRLDAIRGTASPK